ncbi:MAG TPA: hypothetical protein VFS40_15910 [Gemmatimonadales bacterium]|nr:hypothetical protein [Gemmatimonadales bacterium]
MTPAIYALLVASTLCELAPVAAALRWRPLRVLPAPRRLVVLCFLLMFLEDALLWWTARHQGNNLWLGYLAAPVQTTLLLFALAWWQTGAVERRAVRLAAVGFVGLWILLVLGLEDTGTFSRFAAPLRALLVVAVAAWTLVRRSTRTLESPTEEAWFWVATGLLLYFGTGVVLDPVSRLLLRTAPHLVLAAHVAKAGINIVTYFLVARGMLCRLPSGSSGGSSWPPASSPSSSAPPSWSRS